MKVLLEFGIIIMVKYLIISIWLIGTFKAWGIRSSSSFVTSPCQW